MRVRFFTQILFCAFVLFLIFPAQSFAKDEWINVRSKNFFLIGNASDKDMRLVATKLEQFRETFRLIFGRAKFNTSVQTNVVVFKDDSSYNPFRPKLADGKPDEEIAGYFQPGDDLNYITLSITANLEDSYGTIFHEYVHFMVDTNFGRSNVPPWFHEGLAEYYQTFKIEKDQKVMLGDIQSGHLRLLQMSQLIPLKTFFEIDNYSLHQNGNHSRSIFYAQAWALIHYLIQGNKGANTDGMNKFLQLVTSGIEPEKAFQQAFQMDYATMETALRKYVEQKKFQTSIITFKNKLIFDTEMTTVPLTEAEANAYLGDLLYHTHEFENAEPYLQKALALDPNSTMANTSLGLVKMRDRKFDEAKKYLEKAISGNQKNHFVYYNYAYILSRENMDEFGYVAKFSPELVKKMREALQKAIVIKPDFTESYRMLAFINLVNNENLDESIAFLKKGLEIQPGKQEYSMLLAQIYVRQEKIAEAKEIAEKIVKTSSTDEMRVAAQHLLSTIRQIEEIKASNETRQKEMDARGIKQPILKKKSELTEAEIARIKEENEINSLNQMIEKPKEGEQRVLGYIEKIVCAKGGVNYTVKTDKEILTFSSKDFVNLDMISLTEETANLQVGCASKLSDIFTIVTFLPNTNAKIKSKGSVTSLIFVPKFFKLKTAEELAKAQQTYVIEDEPPAETNPNEQAEREKRRREEMLRSIGEALRKPQEGEKREMGMVEKVECSGQMMSFIVKTGTETLKLRAVDIKTVRFAAFTPDAAEFQIGCGLKMPTIPAVITYRLTQFNLKDDAQGELISVEFVPKSFKLQ